MTLGEPVDEGPEDDAASSADDDRERADGATAEDAPADEPLEVAA